MKKVIVTIAQVLAFSVAVLSFPIAAQAQTPTQKIAEGTTFKEEPKSFAVGMYLNPKTMRVYMAIDKAEKNPVKIVLKDKKGKVYFEDYISKNIQNYRFKFDMSQLADGLYTFDVVSKGESTSRSVEIYSSRDRVIAMK